MTKFKDQITNRNLWIIFPILACQAAWNPVVATISNIQIYLASLVLFIFFILRLIIGSTQDHLGKQSDSFPLWAYFGYCLIFLLSVLIHGFNLFALGNFARVSALVLMLIFIRQFEEGLKHLVSAYLFFSFFLCLILLFNLVESGIVISNRISPVGQGSANSFGASLALVLILRFSLQSSHTRSDNLRFYFIGFPVVFLTILGTFSRGATLGLIIGLLVLGMQVIKVAQAPRILGVICLIFAANEIWGFLRLASFSRFSVSSFRDSSGRTVIFQNSIESFLNDPIFGSGVGSKLNPFSSGEASAHNVFLQAVGETGLLGFLFLTLILFIVASRYAPKTSLPALACLFIVSLTDNHFLAVQFHFTAGLVYLSLLRDRHNRELSFNGTGITRLNKTQKS